VFKKIKRFVTTSAFSLMFAVPMLAPVAVSAQTADIQNSVCTGAQLNTDPTTCEAATADAGSNVNGLIADVINIFSLVVGVVAVIMIIVGGFRYITSGGNDSNVSGAKNTILYAIIGLVIVALAQFIVRFVLSRVTTT
jgi:hypothetical protein